MAGARERQHDDAERRSSQAHEFKHQRVHGNLPQQNARFVGKPLTALLIYGAGARRAREAGRRVNDLESAPFRRGPICITMLPIIPEGILMTRHSVSAVLALTGLAAVWIAGAPAYATEQTPQKPGVQQADKSQEECVARRRREGLNIRFAVHRCVNPNN